MARSFIYTTIYNHKLPTSFLHFNEEAQNRKIKYCKVQILPVSTVDKIVQVNMFQGSFIILESYSNLMLMMKFYMQLKIQGLEQVKWEIIIFVPYAIFYLEIL